MRSLAEDDFPFESAASLKTGADAGGPSQTAWQALQKHADRAASAGFVLSMAFLASAAIYGFALSEDAKPLLAEAVAIADRAALDAGYRLEDLSLTGAVNTPQAALFEALKLPYKGSSLFYDTAIARNGLYRIGWIGTASVRRILPSRLEVAITERAPFARWEDASETAFVIDAEGRILGPDKEGRFKSLPLFAGDGAPERASGFQDAFSGYGSLKRRIERAELVAERFWSVKIEGGLTLKLPHKVTPLALDRLDSLLANPTVAEMGLETIDLRLSNRTILQLRDASPANRDRAITLLSSGEYPPALAPRKGKAL